MMDVSSDMESTTAGPASSTVPDTATEPPLAPGHAAGAVPATMPVTEGIVALAEESAAEKALFRSVIRSTIIAIPLCVVIWCGLVALAIAGKPAPDWGVWLGVASGVGVIAGAFFGGWAGFVAKAHVLDELDVRASHREPHDTARP
jgi:hypothetical protein